MRQNGPVKKSGGVEPSTTFKSPKLKVEVKVFANAGIADAKTTTAASKKLRGP